MSASLLTGFPGFIGRRLVRELLAAERKTRVIALVEPRMVEVARVAAEEIDAARIEVLPGDIAEPQLGLDPSDYARLASEVRRVYHLAAIYDLAVPKELAQRVNVDGTGNVLDLCLAAKKLERLVYISTAYVAGKRTGIVYEHELVMGQGFKNHYESTKFQAEVWVRELMGRVPTTVIRPAIVVGDSQTGETQKFDGPYFILRVASRALAHGRPTMQIGRSEANFNVVPIDFVVKAIVAAGTDQAMAGETLHLVDPDPLSARGLVTLLSELYAGRAPRGSVPPVLVEAALRVPALRRYLGDVPVEAIAYLNHSVTFDTRRTVELLRPHGLVPPQFASYAEPVVEFFRAHEHDPAFALRSA